MNKCLDIIILCEYQVERTYALKSQIKFLFKTDCFIRVYLITMIVLLEYLNSIIVAKTIETDFSHACRKNIYIYIIICYF